MTKQLKTVSIQGKEYATVGVRIEFFRKDPEYKGWSLSTDVIEINEKHCVLRGVIKDESDRTIATGIAHETAGSSQINKKSHVENCETSAWGRALGNLGIGLIGGTIASAEEVENAIHQQENPSEEDELNKFKQALFEEMKPWKLSKDDQIKLFQKAIAEKVSINDLGSFLEYTIGDMNA